MDACLDLLQGGIMRTILCYGDSNTWGCIPLTGDRYPENIRWPGVLRKELGQDYQVIEEGLNGRTTVWEDPLSGGYRNGKEYLIPCLESHRPLDLVIIMLGTNDLKACFSLTAYDIAAGAAVLVDLVLKSGTGQDGHPPNVLLIAPPPVHENSEVVFAEAFKGAREKSLRLGAEFHQVASERGCLFLDAGKIVNSSQLDGIHLEAKEHRKLGTRIAELIRDELGWD